MDFKIEEIFFPSTGVELILNLSSLHPTILSSIIYDADFNQQTFIIAMPRQAVKRSTKFKEMHITTLIKKNGINQRVGLKCIPVDSSSQYKLSNGKKISVITIKYTLPVLESNIRSGYRLSLGNEFTARAKIIDDKKEFHSSKHFTLRDISISGVGIIIPKKLGGMTNPLTKININHRAKMEITLVQKKSVNSTDALTIDIEVNRINTYFNELNFLAGLKFLKLKFEDEEKLSRFIHQAQVDELKKLSGI